MSRDYHAPAEEVSLWHISIALERIAATLDDHLDMALLAQEAMKPLTALDPEAALALRPLLDGIDAIRTRRENR